MKSYIGLPGALVPITCPVSEDVRHERSSSELVTFSGRRHVQLGPRVRRSWSVEYGVEHPRDYAVLDALTRWDTPLSWVGALAQATNLLTPEQAALEDVGLSVASQVRGVLQVGDLWVPQWVAGSAISTLILTNAGGVPVRYGVPVTVSAYVERADAATPVQMVFQFLDSTGGVLVSQTREDVAGVGVRRAAWTLSPPEGAATLTVRFRAAAIVAAPQVTWTPTVTPWAPGRGVHRVVVLPGSESPIVAHSKQVLTSAAYTIMEVG